MSFWRPGAARPDVPLSRALESSALVGAQLLVSEGRRGDNEDALIPALLDAGRESLPIRDFTRPLLYALEQHGTVVVIGETGCGKSTQVPQYLYRAGWCSSGRGIIISQPRRVAATSLATRVASEMGCPLGGLVGYTIRFDDCTSPSTRITFATDGALLRRISCDPLLRAYSVVVVDEAHERGMATDVLLGLLKGIQRHRPELRVIVASATLDADRFVAFFDMAADARARRRLERRLKASFASRVGEEEEEGSDQDAAATAGMKRPRVSRFSGAVGEVAPPPPPDLNAVAVVAIPGRVHPVMVHYLDAPCSNFITTSVESVLAIHRRLPPGDILLFLPGAEEIEQACDWIRDQMLAAEQVEEDAKLHVFPLYAALPWEAQQAALAPSKLTRRGVSQRKVIVASSIAETSLTIDGVVYVVDCGYTKMNVHDAATGVEALVMQPVSQAAAAQRAGRAGRICPGHVYRLYTQAAHAALRPTTPPEIQRCDLAPMLLQMLACGVPNIVQFDYVDPPSAKAVARALELLYALRAIDEKCVLTTPVGHALAQLPTDPKLSAALLASLSLGCCDQMVTVAAMLQVRNVSIGWRAGATKTAQATADAAMRAFAVQQGDAITMLNLYDAYETAGRSAAWCRERALNSVAMQRAAEVRSQLRRSLAGIVHRNEARLAASRGGSAGDGVDVADVYGTRSRTVDADPTAAWSMHTSAEASEDADGSLLRRALCAGFFTQAARLGPDGKYVTITHGHSATLHAFTVLARYGGRPAEWVVFCDAVWSSQLQLKDVSAISPRWLLEAAPHYFQKQGGHTPAEEAQPAVPGRVAYRSAAQRRADAEAAAAVRSSADAAADTGQMVVREDVLGLKTALPAAAARNDSVAAMLGMLFGGDVDASPSPAPSTAPASTFANRTSVHAVGTRFAAESQQQESLLVSVAKAAISRPPATSGDATARAAAAERARKAAMAAFLADDDDDDDG